MILVICRFSWLHCINSLGGIRSCKFYGSVSWPSIKPVKQRTKNFTRVLHEGCLRQCFFLHKVTIYWYGVAYPLLDFAVPFIQWKTLLNVILDENTLRTPLTISWSDPLKNTEVSRTQSHTLWTFRCCNNTSQSPGYYSSGVQIEHNKDVWLKSDTGGLQERDAVSCVSTHQNSKYLPHSLLKNSRAILKFEFQILIAILTSFPWCYLHIFFYLAAIFS